MDRFVLFVHPSGLIVSLDKQGRTVLPVETLAACVYTRSTWKEVGRTNYCNICAATLESFITRMQQKNVTLSMSFPPSNVWIGLQHSVVVPLKDGIA